MASFTLLTIGNPKLMKGTKKGYLSFALHLAPADLSGWNVCPASTAGCRRACIFHQGRAGIIRKGEHDNAIIRARLRRTRWFFEDRAAFMAELTADVKRAVKRARHRGLIPVFRLNATSDIRWERMPVMGAVNIMALFPDVQFYDYTKLGNRRDLPANYTLTFSLAENNEARAIAELKAGGNIAVVFRTKAHVTQAITEGYMGYPVFCGDDSDLRFLDPKGHVIALYVKGTGKQDQSGFVREAI
jgi:hypothetical protein